MSLHPEFHSSNLILRKSFAFAVRIVNLSNFLNHQQDFTLAKQVLRSGTAVGALIREAQYGESRRDFVHKLRIAIKEANETCYWLELLYHSRCISQKSFESIHRDGVEILKILTSIINTATKNNQQPKGKY